MTSFSVPGRVLNQFSMSESRLDGTFRIATTTRDVDGDWRDTSNAVFVYSATGERVGQLTGLAWGEQIYSARFAGKRAYLVTSVQTDSLFTITLDVPTRPELLGELKVPGFRLLQLPASHQRDAPP